MTVTQEDRFGTWQLISGLAHFSAALAAIIISQQYPWNITVVRNFNVWSTPSSGTCSEDSPCTVNEYRYNYSRDFNVGLFLAFASIVSMTHHFILASWYVKPFGWVKSKSPGCCTSLKNGWVGNEFRKGVNVIRWLDYAISASIMLSVNSVLFYSPPTIDQLVLWAAVQFGVILAGYGSEVAWENHEVANSFILLFLACIPFGAVWGLNFSMLGVSSSAKEDDSFYIGIGPDPAEFDPEKPPDVVWVFTILLFTSFCIFPIIHFYKIAWFRNPDINSEQGFEKNIRIESLYTSASLLSKVPLLCVYIAATVARETNTKFATQSDRTTTTTTITGTTEAEDEATMSESQKVAYIAAGVCVALGIVCFIDLNFCKKPAPYKFSYAGG